jgi:phage/plasmid-like protein (TIGR03299 family)
VPNLWRRRRVTQKHTLNIDTTNQQRRHVKMPAFVDTMAYAGQVPWHGLGTKLAADAVTDEIIRAAQLEWDVRREMARRHNPVKAEWEKLENRFWLYRSDTGDLISHNTVADGYTPVQNRELFEFGDALTATGAARWHTAGSLHGGARVWGLAQVAGQFEVMPGDTIAPYLLLYDARDKSSTFKCRFTTVRVVCANTAAMALSQKDATEVSIRHTGDVAKKLEQAAEILGLAETSFQKQTEVAEMLAAESFSEKAMQMFVIQMATGEDDEEKALDIFRGINAKGGRALTNLNHFGDEVMKRFAEEETLAGFTKWNAFNRITEFVDHQRGRMSNWKRTNSRLTGEGLDSAWFGEGERKKKRALKLLVGGGVSH